MRVSVVIPAFNRAHLLPEAIASVRYQTLLPYELIVVDDGSTDTTPDVATGCDCLLVRQPNRGVSAARNAGARVASGDAIFFLDSDDILLPQALANCVKWMTAKSANAVMPNFVIDQNAMAQSFFDIDEECRVLERRHVRPLLRFSVGAANSLVRRDEWERHQYDERLRSAEDLSFWLELLVSGGTIALTRECLVIVRTAESGRLSNDIRAMRRNRGRTYWKWFARPELTATERATALWRVITSTIGLTLQKVAASDRLLGRLAYALDRFIVKWTEGHQCRSQKARNRRTSLR